jgi:hypothetical protein
MFGKILVLTHFGLSLCFATWALVLWANRVDWSSEKGKAGKPDGELVARIAEYDRVARPGVRVADARWRAARKVVQDNEAWLPYEQAWYERELNFLRSGTVTKDTSIRQIDRGPDGNVIILPNPAVGGALLQIGPIRDPAGQPFKGRKGEPLDLNSLDYYDKEYPATITQMTVILRKLQDEAKRDRDATKEMIGPKGLQARLEFEKLKQARIKDEHDEVRPLWLNTAVELKNLEELRLRLQVRLKELENQISKGDKEGR